MLRHFVIALGFEVAALLLLANRNAKELAFLSFFQPAA